MDVALINNFFLFFKKMKTQDICTWFTCIALLVVVVLSVLILNKVSKKGKEGFKANGTYQYVLSNEGSAGIGPNGKSVATRNGLTVINATFDKSSQTFHGVMTGSMAGQKLHWNESSVTFEGVKGGTHPAKFTGGRVIFMLQNNPWAIEPLGSWIDDQAAISGSCLDSSKLSSLCGIN